MGSVYVGRDRRGRPSSTRGVTASVTTTAAHTTLGSSVEVRDPLHTGVGFYCRGRQKTTLGVTASVTITAVHTTRGSSVEVRDPLHTGVGF